MKHLLSSDRFFNSMKGITITGAGLLFDSLIKQMKDYWYKIQLVGIEGAMDDSI